MEGDEVGWADETEKHYPFLCVNWTILANIKSMIMIKSILISFYTPNLKFGTSGSKLSMMPFLRFRHCISLHPRGDSSIRGETACLGLGRD